MYDINYFLLQCIRQILTKATNTDVRDFVVTTGYWATQILQCACLVRQII